MSASPEPLFEIPEYHRFISPALAKYLLQEAKPVEGIENLKHLGEQGGLETKEGLRFLVHIYQEIKADLKNILRQRVIDREFIDARVRACARANDDLGRDILHEDYLTVLGLEDGSGRVVFGPLHKNYCRSGGKKIAPIPEFMKGHHVTLFGPPDSAKMAVNAMNALHRKLDKEPPIVETLVAENDCPPKWGADDEDSKTPLRADLVDAAVNLTACFEKTISFIDEKSGKSYRLAQGGLAMPMKRFPGLALPSTFLFFEASPIPLHLYDFALHLFRNWKNPEALVFYVPKLENEEEAKYIHKMISVAESEIQKLHPDYKLGTVRLMIVLENPRAIVRTHEIMDALYPYFIGASLGWHDYLASMARLFKEDWHYRIPVKADPDIVVKYIKASHLLLADVVGSRGGIKVGGMYGILPLTNNITTRSFQVTMKGFFKDVITQMKRDLTGFWVAHPDFVRIGIAIVEAYRLYKLKNQKPLKELIEALLTPKDTKEIWSLVRGKDVKGLNNKDKNYVRSLIVADIKESDYIPNNHPDEIRYNVFQSLQYLTDWLCGNGCVALPALVSGVPVRVMDDLATAERSRWEVWHEIRHGRFSLDEFLKIVNEEYHFIRKDLSNDKKSVQVKWSEKTEKWYPVAREIMIQLMTAESPVEFATELLMPFTNEKIRSSQTPLDEIRKIDPQFLRQNRYIERFQYFFEACGSLRFARDMASNPILDKTRIPDIFQIFTVQDIVEAAFFHGNIGENKKTLDSQALLEQKLVSESAEKIRQQLLDLGNSYLKKFGFKYLISAKDKKPDEILKNLKSRIQNTRKQEVENAKKALCEITLKRISLSPFDEVYAQIEKKIQEYDVAGLSIAINEKNTTQCLAFGEARKGKDKVTVNTQFEIASLSKTLASAFAIEFFKQKNISLKTSVQELLKKYNSPFRLDSKVNPDWVDAVCIEHLMNHSALNQHYVNGFSIDQKIPPISDLISGDKINGYEKVSVLGRPGQSFHYSGGGFLILEHLIELVGKKSAVQLGDQFLKKIVKNSLTFQQSSQNGREYACGHLDSGALIPGGRLIFPSFAAGAMGTPCGMAQFLNVLTQAFHGDDKTRAISQDTAVEMLVGQNWGSREFMGVDAGMGVFIAEAEQNRFAIHQGANDGFRSIYIHCFKGPDQGKGFVIFANGDNRAVELIAKVSQVLLQHLQFRGISFQNFEKNISNESVSQENKVNKGYKNLIFDAFLPDLPEKIVRKKNKKIRFQNNLLEDGNILFCTNQKFARAENLISSFEPEFDPELFGAQGKIMDSWESARHNPSDFDELIIALKKPGPVSYVWISTKYHDGNQAPYVEIEGLNTQNNQWKIILPRFQMNGHSEALLRIEKSSDEYSQVKIRIYPDGGLTRVGMYSQISKEFEGQFLPISKAKCIRNSESIPKSVKPLAISYRVNQKEIRKNLQQAKKMKLKRNMVSLAMGGQILRASNEHYGPAVQVISPFPPLHMFDGLESARSREPGHHESVELKLAKPIRIQKIIFDFQYFVNNNPKEIEIEGFSKGKWIPVVLKTNIKKFAGNKKIFSIQNKNIFTKLRIKTIPDGGINRIIVLE